MQLVQPSREDRAFALAREGSIIAASSPTHAIVSRRSVRVKAHNRVAPWYRAGVVMRPLWERHRGCWCAQIAMKIMEALSWVRGKGKAERVTRECPSKNLPREKRLNLVGSRFQPSRLGLGPLLRCALKKLGGEIG